MSKDPDQFKRSLDQMGFAEVEGKYNAGRWSKLPWMHETAAAWLAHQRLERAQTADDRAEAIIRSQMDSADSVRHDTRIIKRLTWAILVITLGAAIVNSWPSISSWFV